MNKLKAIWNIIRSTKFAVFTYEEVCSENSEYMQADYFRWNISEKDSEFLKMAQERLNNIINHEEK